MMKEIKRLHALGFAVHLLRPKSKAPLENKWTTGPRKTLDELKAAYKPGMNIGVRLGKESALVIHNEDLLKRRHFLAAIDCDVKSRDKKHTDEMEEKLFELFGEKLTDAPCVASGRGNGSKHIYVVTGAPAEPKRLAQSFDKVKVHMPSVRASKGDIERLSSLEIEKGMRMRPAWEISFMGEGQQVVLPPSIHPDSGKHYIWSRPLTSLAALPLIEQKKGAVREEVENEKKPFTPVEVFLELEGLSPRIEAMITTGEGCDDRSAGLFAAALGMCRAGMSDDAILTVLTDKKNYLGDVAYEHTQSSSRAKAAEWVRRYTLSKARNETDAARDFDLEVVTTKLDTEEAETQEKEILGVVSWKSQIERSGKNADGAPKPTLKNINLILSNAVAQPLFKSNDFAFRHFYGIDTPWGEKKDCELDDTSMVRIKHWLSENFSFEPSVNAIEEATALGLSRNKYHPVRDYLNELPAWDGVLRIDTWLKKYLGAKAREPYLSEISRKFMIGMVARIFEPGVKFDNTLIFEGVEDIGKSSMCAILAGGKENFLDNLPNLDDKDARLNLQGKWIIEIGELANIRYTSIEKIKAFLSCQTDRVRPPYGKRSIDLPRQCMFIGTTNDYKYLKGNTGNRRFWPTLTTKMEFDLFRADRDQLFAEALVAYRAGEALEISKKAKEQARREQMERLGEDENLSMQEALLDFLDLEKTKPETERMNLKKFKLAEMFQPERPFGNWNSQSYSLQNAAQVLSQNGFNKRVIEGRHWWRKLDKKGGEGAAEENADEVSMW